MSDRNEPVKVAAKGSPALMILMVVVVGPAFLVGSEFGAGGASIIGGFVALFTLLAVMGGPLRADLRRFAIVGPLIAVSAVTPRILAEVSVPAAIALTTLVIFIGGLLPLRSRRYDSVSLGLGMGTLFGYAIPLGAGVGSGQLVAAALAGLVVALLLRLLLGAKDPAGPTRKAVADLLAGESEDFAAAFDTWSTDRPTRWLGTVLSSAVRYRLARLALTQKAAGDVDGAFARILDNADVRAKAIAAEVRSKNATNSEILQTAAADTGTRQPDEAMSAALDAAERAARDRDSTRVSVPAGVTTRINVAAVRAAIWHGSVQVRHAFRTAIAVLLALIVATRLDVGDPLLPSLLMTTFAVVQLSWGATLTKARDRLLGLLVGGILVVFTLLVLPQSWLLPVSLLGLVVGLWFITAKPAVGVAGILLMSVGINSSLRHLDPWDVIVEYVLLTVIAIVIGGLIGFVVIPAWKPKPLKLRIDSAMNAAASALLALGLENSPEHPEPTLRRLDSALAAVQQLAPDRDKLSDPQIHELDRLRASMNDVLLVSLFVLSSRPKSDDDSEALRDAAEILTRSRPTTVSPTETSSMNDVLRAIAGEAVQQRARLDGVLA